MPDRLVACEHVKSAFVAMPFADRFDYLYHHSIKAAASEVGLKLVRLGRLPVDEILPRMEEEIADADLVIAITTDRNPHVYFEIALAYAAKKPCIVMAEDEADFEIFRNVFRCFTYGADMTQLRIRLREALIHLASDNDKVPSPDR